MVSHFFLPLCYWKAINQRFYEVSHELSQLLYVVPHTLGVCSISPHSALSFSLTSLHYFVALTPFVFAMGNYTSAAPKTTPR